MIDLVAQSCESTEESQERQLCKDDISTGVIFFLLVLPICYCLMRGS